MGTMVFSLLWVMQDLYHLPNVKSKEQRWQVV